jgi:hypothetical protein
MYSEDKHTVQLKKTKLAAVCQKQLNTTRYFFIKLASGPVI